MSTPAWKKRMNIQKQAVAKQKRDYDKLFASDPNYKPEKKVLQWNPTSPRETQYVPSLMSNKGNTNKVEPRKYTGDYIVGIATMHKSNLVPVCKDDNPKNYATMRRN